MRDKDKTKDELLQELQELSREYESLQISYQQGIAERKHLEENLGECKLLYQNLANSGSALIWTAGLDKLCNFFNEPWLKFTGRTIEQELGNGWAEGVHPEDFDRCLETYVAAFDKREPFEMEYRLRHVSGEYKIILDIGTPNFNSNGEFSGYIGHCFDITERKLMEEALRESEATFRTIFEIASLGIAQVEPTNGKIILINTYYETITGYSIDELLNMTFLELTHPEDKEKDWEIFRRAAQGEVQYKNEKRYVKKDGTIIWVRIHLAFIRDENGNPNKTVAICEDITHRKITESEILKLSQAVEQSPVSVIITNLNGKIEYVNLKFVELTGYSINEVVGNKPSILKSGEFPEDKYKKLWETILSGDTWRGEFHNKKKNGELYWEFATISPIINEEGKIINFLAVKEDITDRKQAEKDLRQIQSHFRVAQEMSPDGFTILHPIRNEIGEVIDFTWVYENQAIAHINGTNPNDVIGKRILELFPTHIGTPVYDSYLKVVSTGKTEILEEIYVGEIVSVHTWIRLVVVSMGEDIAILTQNITERKQAEEKLRLLSRAVAESSLSIVISDAKGNIVFTNPSFTKISGYSSEEVYGRKMRILNPGKLSLTDSEKLWSAINTGNGWSGEYQNRKKNGEIYWEKSNISPVLNSKGNLTNIMSINEDITDRKDMLEELVRAKAQAEESDKLKSAFLQNMSHEIRTPLNGILGFTRLLEFDDIEKDEKIEYISLIKKSSKRLQLMVDNIIEVSKISTGQIALDISEFSIKELFIELIEDNLLSAKDKNLALDFDLNKGANDAINSDKVKLVLVFNSLISNSIKFTPAGGKIEIGAVQNINNSKTYKESKKSNINDKTLIHFYVKDNGIGIDKSHHNQIFENFFQVDGSISRQFEGAGLGLSICKGLLELLNGKIWVESEPGKGSTFWFSLPI